MKTILFIYFDNVLKSKLCDSYIVKSIEECIKWRIPIYKKEMERGEITNLQIEILDSISIKTMQHV